MGQFINIPLEAIDFCAEAGIVAEIIDPENFIWFADLPSDMFPSRQIDRRCRAGWLISSTLSRRTAWLCCTRDVIAESLCRWEWENAGYWRIFASRKTQDNRVQFSTSTICISTRNIVKLTRRQLNIFFNLWW